MQSVPQVYLLWKVFQCRHGAIDWSAGLVGQRAENVLKWLICRCNYTCTPAFVFLNWFVFVFRLHFYLNDTLKEVCVESLGGLGGHRDKKVFNLSLALCVYVCLHVLLCLYFQLYLYLYLQSTLLEGWVDYLGGQVKNVSKLWIWIALHHYGCQESLQLGNRWWGSDQARSSMAQLTDRDLWQFYFDLREFSLWPLLMDCTGWRMRSHL